MPGDDRLPTAESLRESTAGYHVGWREREFTDWVDEQMSWKETCYIGDWSFLPECRLRGAGARRLLSDLSVNSMDGFDVGEAKHVVQCDDDGHIVAEGLLMHLDDEEYSLSANPAFWTGYNLERGDYDATWETVETFNFQVQGPNSVTVLEGITDGSLRDIEFINFGDVTIAGRDVTVVRMGMAGEAGFELQGPAEYADEIWEAVLEAGEPHGIRRLGARTVMINHLEACFPTRGKDYLPAIYHDEMAAFNEWKLANGGSYTGIAGISGSFEGDDIRDWYRTPVELGWADNVAFDHEFVGRDALEAEVRNPSRTMVTLEWNAEDVGDVYQSLFREETYQPMDLPTEQHWSMRADSVLADDEEVGVSTSRGYSYYFKEMLSLCSIDVAYADPVTEVTVVWGDLDWPKKEINATVAPAPYKTDRRRRDLAEFD